MSKRIFISLIAVFVVTAISFSIWKRVMPNPLAPGTISTSGGREMSLRNSEGKTYFLQNDPEWGEEKIGGSGETIGQVGCTLCSLAMAVSDLGHEIDPPTLNNNLIAHSGYTGQGWLIWGAVPASTDGFAEVVYCDKPTYRQIDTCLEKGEYPIVKIFLPGPIQHWVTVVGKDGDEYLIKDPAVRTKKIVKLSSRAPAIHALRYVRRKEK